MITKHKTSIALAACLLLAQSNIMQAGAPNLSGLAKLADAMLVVYKAAIVAEGALAGYLLYDAIVDREATLRWQRIQEQREAYVKNALAVAQDLQLKLTQEEAQKKAEEKHPGNGPVATSVWKRMLKGGLGTATLALTAYSAYPFFRKYS